MEEPPLPRVIRQYRLLDGKGLIEPEEGLEAEGAFPAAFSAVGLLLRRKLPEHLDLVYDAVADEGVALLRLLRQQDDGAPFPAPHRARIVLLQIVDLFEPLVRADAEDISILLILGHDDGILH